MREIKFRAWDGINGGYTFSGFYPTSKIFAIFVKKVNNLKYVIEQYIGSHSENEKEIYEGDIVESVDWNEYFSDNNGPIKEFKRQFEIVFHNAAFCLREIKTDLYFPIDKGKLKIIGNIHENPELLK